MTPTCSPALGATAIRSLLVVDDSRVQRHHAARLARELGVTHLHEACHGVEALAVLDRLDGTGHPDAVIIDLEMPVMDGVQLIQQLCGRGLDVPFVVASTREPALIEAVMTVASALGRPAACALRKPYDAPALADALERCARRAPPVNPPVPTRLSRPIDEERLSQAVAGGQVVPHYQPKVDVRTGLLRGVEVLARWHDPVLGPVRPDAFVAVAERCGLIQPLTMSILGQALEQAAHWRSRGLDLTIAVNLSPLLLSRPALVDEIGEQLERHGARPEQLTLEITEGSVVAYQGLALGTLARLRMRGYGLSIDDYGTGFSSMQQLARIPFTEMKIDRAFVHRAHAQPHLRVMLQSAIEMSARLSIGSVAEGVETMADWRLLQELGCSLAQGWLIAKAMPSDDVPGWLQQHAGRLPSLRAALPETGASGREIVQPRG